MILVDSSVWIDYFNGKNHTSQTDWLDSSLGSIPIIMGDLILTEVLPGFQNAMILKTARDLLLGIPFMSMGGQSLALESAMNYEHLRKKGLRLEKPSTLLSELSASITGSHYCIATTTSIPWSGIWD